MSVLRKYLQGDKGRFYFRISDGLGNYLKPDWDDPDLKVEFFDAGGDCVSPPPRPVLRPSLPMRIAAANISILRVSPSTLFPRAWLPQKSTAN